MRKTIFVNPITNVGEMTVCVESEDNNFDLWNYKIYSYGSKDLDRIIEEQEQTGVERNLDYRSHFPANSIKTIYNIIKDITYHFLLTNEDQIVKELVAAMYKNENNCVDYLKFVKDFKMAGYYPKTLIQLYVDKCMSEAMWDKVEDNYYWAENSLKSPEQLTGRIDYNGYSVRGNWDKFNNKYRYVITTTDDISCDIVDSGLHGTFLTLNQALNAGVDQVKKMLEEI